MADGQRRPAARAPVPGACAVRGTKDSRRVAAEGPGLRFGHDACPRAAVTARFCRETAARVQSTRSVPRRARVDRSVGLRAFEPGVLHPHRRLGPVECLRDDPQTGVGLNAPKRGVVALLCDRDAGARASPGATSQVVPSASRSGARWIERPGVSGLRPPPPLSPIHPGAEPLLRIAQDREQPCLVNVHR